MDLDATGFTDKTQMECLCLVFFGIVYFLGSFC